MKRHGEQLEKAAGLKNHDETVDVPAAHNLDAPEGLRAHDRHWVGNSAFGVILYEEFAPISELEIE